MKKLFNCICLGVFLIVSGCSSDSEDCEVGAVENPNQQGPIDGAIYKQSALDCRVPKLQVFQFNNYTSTEIKANQNTILYISEGTFQKLDGTIIDGEITFSILEMYNAGEIIACQLSTNGINSNQTVEPLLSESIFYINAEHNGNPVLMNGEIQVFIPSDNENLDLSLFVSPSCNEIECPVLWEVVPQYSVFEEPYQDASGNIISGYRAVIGELGWYSFARYNPSTEERGVLYNKALSPYSLANSNVFLKYDSNSIGVGMFSEYDTENEVFSEKFSQIPRNTVANVIFVSKPESEFLFDSSPVITNDGKITVTRNTKNGSERNLVDYINNL